MLPRSTLALSNFTKNTLDGHRWRQAGRGIIAAAGFVCAAPMPARILARSAWRRGRNRLRHFAIDTENWLRHFESLRQTGCDILVLCRKASATFWFCAATWLRPFVPHFQNGSDTLVLPRDASATFYAAISTPLRHFGSVPKHGCDTLEKKRPPDPLGERRAMPGWSLYIHGADWRQAPAPVAARARPGLPPARGLTNHP